MKLTKDQLAALRYADSDKGLDYMNGQLAAFLEGIKYARDEMVKAAIEDKAKASVDACIDIFKDYDESEISELPTSTRYAWIAGRDMVVGYPPDSENSKNK